jgi:hypothetical protein
VKLRAVVVALVVLERLRRWRLRNLRPSRRCRDPGRAGGLKLDADDGLVPRRGACQQNAIVPTRTAATKT